MRRPTVFLCLAILAPLSRAIPLVSTTEGNGSAAADVAMLPPAVSRARDEASVGDYPYKLRVDQVERDVESHQQRAGGLRRAAPPPQQRGTLNAWQHRDWNLQLRVGGAAQGARYSRATGAAQVEARMNYRINPRQSLSLRAGYGLTLSPGTAETDWTRVSAVLNLRF